MKCRLKCYLDVKDRKNSILFPIKQETHIKKQLVDNKTDYSLKNIIEHILISTRHSIA